MPVTPTTTGIDPYSVTFEPSTPESISAKATGKVERPAALEVEVSKDSYSYLTDFGKVTSRAPRLNEPSATPSQNDYNKALAETGNLGGENAYAEMEGMMILFEKISKQQVISAEKATMADAQAQETMMQGSADELRSSATAALIGGLISAGLSIGGAFASGLGAASDIAELSSAEDEFNTSASETTLNEPQQNQIEETDDTGYHADDDEAMGAKAENEEQAASSDQSKVADDDESQKSPMEKQRAFERAKMAFQNKMTKMNLQATKLQGWVAIGQGLGSVASGIGQDASGQFQAQAKEDEAKATYQGGLQQNMQQFMSSAQQNVEAAQSALESVMQGYASTSEKLV
jgi:hypothetical protein